MAAGKLLVMLVVGGLAGAAFASMTTGVMRPYHDRASAAANRPLRSQADDGASAYSAPSAGRSWLDEGLSVLDSSAWPFGRGSGEEAGAQPYPARPDDYAVYDYAPRDAYPDDRWGQDGPHNHQMQDPYSDTGYGDDAYAPDDEGPAYGDERDLSADRMPAVRGPARRADAATDAAIRAAQAAQDVRAAEHAN